MAASGAGDLGAAVDLIMQPWLLEVLVAADCGEALEDAPSAGTGPMLLGAAVRRLTALGAIEASPDGPFGRHVLTARGRRLLRVLDDLDDIVSDADASSSTDLATRDDERNP